MSAVSARALQVSSMAALRQISTASMLSATSIYPRLISPLQTSTSPPSLSRFLWPILSTPLAVPLTLRFGVPSLLSELWESILRAVPKKKTSHRKKRQRFLAGKALQDVTALNKCSACGNVKRAHLLCPFCVNGPFYLT